MLLSINTDMYELAILTGRRYFKEPNKVSFTNFGYLYHFILIIKVQLKNKNEKLFLFSMKKITESGPTRPTRGVARARIWPTARSPLAH